MIEQLKEEVDRMEYTCMEESKQKTFKRNKDTGEYDISSDECVKNAKVFQFLLYK